MDLLYLSFNLIYIYNVQVQYIIIILKLRNVLTIHT